MRFRIVWDTMIGADTSRESRGIERQRFRRRMEAPERVHLAYGDYGRASPKIDRTDYIRADFKPL
jgi:hypothetical protein